jgi:hypothetical protein
MYKKRFFYAFVSGIVYGMNTRLQRLWSVENVG